MGRNRRAVRTAPQRGRNSLNMLNERRRAVRKRLEVLLLVLKLRDDDVGGYNKVVTAVVCGWRATRCRCVGASVRWCTCVHAFAAPHFHVLRRSDDL